MQKDYKLLILAFFLLNLFGWIAFIEAKYGIPQIVKYALSVLILGIIIFYKLKNPSQPVPEGLFYPVIIFFIIWSIILLILGIIGFRTILSIKLALADPYFFIPYLLPILLLFSKFDLKFFGNLFYYSYIVIIPAVIAQLIIISVLSRENWYEQSSIIGVFDICSAFLLLTAHISKKRNISYLVLCYYLLWVFLWSFYGRRGALIQSLLLLTIMVIIRMRSSFLKIHDRIKIYLSGILLIILFLAYGYLFTSSYAFQRGFNRDAFEASRGTVFNAFFYDFGSTTDWVFGRGINGTILRSLSTYDEFSTIENGFLTILLKGGLVYSIPFVVILLRASYLGFFRSNNDLAKALASIILLYVIMMFYFNLPSYSTDYVFVWISVSACFTASLRNHSNAQVYQAINSRFK